jgi:hypothetical protein
VQTEKVNGCAEGEQRKFKSQDMKEKLKNGHEWRFKEVTSSDYELWVSNYYSSDGDGVELYIQKDKGGFELNCFSGIPASKIFIDSVDFNVFCYYPNKIGDLNFEESYDIQCIKIADYICGKFCEYTE